MRTTARVSVYGCVWAVFLAITAAAAATSVPLALVERGGVDRVGQPVTTGVPIPKGKLTNVRNVRLLCEGKPIPAQFRAAGLWRPGKSVRWLLVDCRVDVKANGRRQYTLEYGPSAPSGPGPATGVRIAEGPDGFVVHTGAARFRISKKGFSLFDEVRVGETVVVPSAAGPTRRGAEVRGLRATVTRAIPNASNRGRSHLIYVRCGPKPVAEDYTLRFVSDREYEVVGGTSGRLGRGAYRKDFSAAAGAVAIPAGAWLPYAMPRKGDVYTFRTVASGPSAAAEGVFEAKAIERGRLRSVIRVKGSFGPASAPVLEYTAWYHFHAGSGRVKLAFTLENNGHGGRTPSGNARNADIGGINSVFFDEMVLRLPLALGGAGRVRLGRGGGNAPAAETLNATVQLYQDSSGSEHWSRYRNRKYHPRPNSYVTFKGYRIYKGGRELLRGDRADGWMDVAGRSAGVTVGVEDFWQNFPKALSAAKDGSVEIGLFPGRYAGRFCLRSGEHKTHEVLLDFFGGGGNGGDDSRARGLCRPLRLEPSAEWFAKTRALGDLRPYDAKNYRAYEVRNLSAVGIFPEGARRGASLFSRRDEHEFYGWMDYGDVPMDFETPSGQWGMKYDMDYHMAQQYARTLRPQWWDLFVAADKHTRDIDIHHQPHHPVIHFVKGGVWAHSLHGEPGHKNPHRNRNHFTKDLCFGGRGTATLYYFTGDWKSHDACLEIAENALARYMSPQKDPGDAAANNRMGWRGDACTLNRLLEGYLLRGDERLRRHARWQVKSCAFDGRPARHEAISLWSSVFYMMALARYVEMFPDHADAKKYLLAHIETLRRSVDPARGILYTITPRPDGSVVGKGTCSHYNIMAADALAVAYRITGEKKYMDAARRCFAYGVKNACWAGGPPTYTQVHSANGAMHGNVFMAVDSAGRAKGR